MTAEKKQSALRPILENVYAATDRESALKIVTDYLAEPDCVILASQRRSMLVFAHRCQTLSSLQSYITNSFMYFEGNGVVKPGYRGRFR
jgi:hypothetical protein